MAVVVLATLLVGFGALVYAFDDSPIDRQAKNLAGVCPVRTSARWLEVDRTTEPACQAAADQALAAFGFGRAGLVAAAGRPLARGEWRLTVTLPAGGGVRARVERVSGG